MDENIKNMLGCPVCKKPVLPIVATLIIGLVVGGFLGFWLTKDFVAQSTTNKIRAILEGANRLEPVPETVLEAFGSVVDVNQTDGVFAAKAALYDDPLTQEVEEYVYDISVPAEAKIILRSFKDDEASKIPDVPFERLYKDAPADFSTIAIGDLVVIKSLENMRDGDFSILASEVLIYRSERDPYRP